MPKSTSALALSSPAGSPESHGAMTTVTYDSTTTTYTTTTVTTFIPGSESSVHSSTSSPGVFTSHVVSTDSSTLSSETSVPSSAFSSISIKGGESSSSTSSSPLPLSASGSSTSRSFSSLSPLTSSLSSVSLFSSSSAQMGAGPETSAITSREVGGTSSPISNTNSATSNKGSQETESSSSGSPTPSKSTDGSKAGSPLTSPAAPLSGGNSDSSTGVSPMTAVSFTLPSVTLTYDTSLPSGTLEAAAMNSKSFIQTTGGKAGIGVLLAVLVVALIGFVVFVFRSRRRHNKFVQGVTFADYPDEDGGSLAGLNQTLGTLRGQDDLSREAVSPAARVVYKPWRQQRRPVQDAESSFYDRTPVATMGWASHQPDENPFTPENPFNDSHATRRNSYSTVEPSKYPHPPQPSSAPVPVLPPLPFMTQTTGNHEANGNFVLPSAPSMHEESVVMSGTDEESLANAEVRMAIAQRQNFRPLTPPSESSHTSSSSGMSPQELVKNHKLLLRQTLQSSSPTRF